MDVYIDKKEKVWVVNVEEYDEAMNTGLFTKDELDAILDKEEMVYRVVEEEGNTLPSEQLFYQLPLDMQKLSSDKEVAEFISNLKQYRVCETKPQPRLTTLMCRCVHHLHVLHESICKRTQVRHQREVLQLLVEHRHEFLLRYHRYGSDGIEHLASLLLFRPCP